MSRIKSHKLPIIISDTVVKLIHAEWVEALIWRPLQTIIGSKEFLGETTRFADNIEAIKPLTRRRYRWNRFWKRVRHPFKKNLFWKITYIYGNK